MIKNNCTIPFSNPVFKAYRHSIVSNGIVLNRGDTCLFRQDLDFHNLVNFLNDKYKNEKKVEVIAHACSDGEEVFSFLSKLIDSIGEEIAQKFLPILAKDINSEHLEKAKSGKFRIEAFELKAIKFYLGDKYAKYFTETKENIDATHLKVNDILKKNIIFKLGNIIDDIKTINKKNVVLFARNFWGYLDSDKRDELAEKLSQTLDKSSTLIIGDFDRLFDIPYILKKFGFKETNIKNVFENTAIVKNDIDVGYFGMILKLIKK